MNYTLSNTVKTMRLDAIESEMFYKNKLADTQVVKKYFPVGADSETYSQRPKLVFPFSATITERLLNILHFGMSVNIEDNEELNSKIQDILKQNDFTHLSRESLKNVLIGGNLLTLITSDQNGIKYINWTAPYLRYIGEEIYCYEYELKDNIMYPITALEGLREENIVSVVLTPYSVGDYNHALGFTPAVWFKNIDTYDDNYGQSYINRFKKLNIEYNQIASQIAYSLKVLQNIWVTNAAFEQSLNPIELSVDKINFLGEGIELKQVTRELNLEEERQMLAILKSAIYNSAQIPENLADLTNVSKLPSGIALQILFQPLSELAERIRSNFTNYVVNLIEKSIKILYFGKTIPKYTIKVNLNKTLIPEDRDQKIKELVELAKEDFIDKESAKELISTMLGIVKNV